MRRISTTYTLLAGLCAFLLWASLFEIDETARARGKIVVEGRAQVVQSAEGGVLRDLAVQEGDRVVAGQLLAVMDSAQARAAVDEITAEIETNQLARARAEAELAGRAPEFGGLAARFPQVASAQLALHAGNMAALASELSFAQKSRDVAQNQLDALEKLAASGDISRVEVARASRDVIQAEGAIAAVREKYRAQALKDIALIEQQISTLEFRLAGRKTSVDFARLTAPQAGIVTELKTNTLGAVLKAGDELMRLSPTSGARIAEVMIAPMDVGRLEIGQPVAVQLDAFSSTIYGALQARLSYLSADTITSGADGRAQTYYLARIALDRVQENPRIPLDALRPGMEVTVDVKTGRRSVMTYLAKPILRGFGGALSER